jgi:uncharacterized protein (DUF2164 family)
MALQLSRDDTAALVASLQKYCRTELDVELSEMRAGFLLTYVLQEIAPFAYNQGVKDAEEFMRGRLEDLSGVCFEQPLTYWKAKRS